LIKPEQWTFQYETPYLVFKVESITGCRLKYPRFKLPKERKKRSKQTKRISNKLDFLLGATPHLIVALWIEFSDGTIKAHLRLLAANSPLKLTL
jgi:hypothetical protein